MSIRNGGQRVATVLMYLSSMQEGGGGETVFPNSVQRPAPEEASQLSGEGWIGHGRTCAVSTCR